MIEKIIKLFSVSIFILSFVYSKPIGIYSGLNQNAFSNEKQQHKSLLNNLLNLTYFNLQYYLSDKNSMGLELSSNKNKSLLSLQYRYSIIKNEKLYSGFSMGYSDSFNLRLNTHLGMSRDIGNALLIGVITNIPIDEPDNLLINLYIGAKL